MTKLEALKTISTPAFLFDYDTLSARCALLTSLATEKQVTLCYAMKANPFLLSFLKDKLPLYEVCSPGEYAIAKKSGILPTQIVFSGVNKEKEDIEQAIHDECSVVTVESVLQFRKIQAGCKLLGKRQAVLLRLTSGNQFGMDKETVCNLLKEQDGKVPVVGLQYYSGTQKTISQMEKELSVIVSFCKEHAIKRLEYGPGLPVSYFDGKPDENKEIELFKKLLSLLPEEISVTLEIGRFLVASSGSYITTVMDEKYTDGERYVIVDGGINQLTYYGQVFGMRKPPIEEIGPNGENTKAQNSTICGSLCTVSDVLIKGVPLIGGIGDRLVFGSCGAYAVTEGIALFLSRDLPSVFGFSEKMGLSILRERKPTYGDNTPEERG